MPADTNPGLAQTGNSQKDKSQTGDTSGVVNPAKNRKNQVGTDRKGSGKPHADTAENENTTEADLVLNEDLNSSNDI